MELRKVTGSDAAIRRSFRTSRLLRGWDQGERILRETLTRVLRSYRLAYGPARGNAIAAQSFIHARDPHPQVLHPQRTVAGEQPVSALRTDCDFDPDLWDRGACDGLATAGIARVVLNRLPASTASLSPLAGADAPAWRAVIAAPPHLDAPMLARLHASGVRGLRFAIDHLDSGGLDPVLKLADRIVPYGWHIELNVAAAGAYRALAKAEWSLMQFPLAVCVSGLSCARHGRAADAADIAFLLGLMQLGRYWLKLASDDLAPAQLQLWDEPSPLARALAGTRRDRLVWGSGPRAAEHGADGLSAGLAVLERCMPQPADRDAILVANPATLYDF
jgi:predicted TIM-barrel fold metal-dependent hydrolase